MPNSVRIHPRFEIIHSKGQMSTSWHKGKSQEIIKVIRIHHPGTINPWISKFLKQLLSYFSRGQRGGPTNWPTERPKDKNCRQGSARSESLNPGAFGTHQRPVHCLSIRSSQQTKATGWSEWLVQAHKNKWINTHRCVAWSTNTRRR